MCESLRLRIKKSQLIASNPSHPEHISSLQKAFRMGLNGHKLAGRKITAALSYANMSGLLRRSDFFKDQAMQNWQNARFMQGLCARPIFKK